LTMRTKAFSKRRDNPHTSGGDIPEDFTDSAKNVEFYE
jgi:hypothetical protein